MTIITTYFCRKCQATFRPRKGKGGRSLCEDCAAGKDVPRKVVDLFQALKDSLEKYR